MNENLNGKRISDADAIVGVVCRGFRLLRGADGDFGQDGVADLNSDLATLVRTVVILIVTVAIVSAREE